MAMRLHNLEIYLIICNICYQHADNPPPQFLALTTYLASVAFVQYRGKEKMKLKRQMGDFSTFLAPFNAVIYAFSQIPNKPFFELKDFPQLQQLTNSWETIRDEGLALMEGGMVNANNADTELGFHSFLRTGWKRFHLKWYNDPLPSAQKLCPKTEALLQSIPGIHGAMFALLPPGARFGKHRDPFAGSVCYHLGLRTPNSDDCWIDIDDIRYSWRDGEAVLFDETYVHHAKNDTDVNRLILFCDVERPMKNALARAFNHFLINHVMKATASHNEEGEKPGVINRAFKPFFRLKLFLKSQKRKNRRVNMTIKYMIITVVLALIFFL